MSTNPSTPAGALWQVGIAVAMILMAVVVTPQPAHGQTCTRENIPAFKVYGEAGDLSYINRQNDSLTVGINNPIPTFSIRIYYKLNSQSQRELDLDATGYVEAVSSPIGLKLSGASVTINKGEVTFRSLTIQTGPQAGTDYTLQFNVVLDSTNSTPNIYTLSTGTLTFEDVATKSTILDSVRFGDFGYFFREGVSKAVPAEIPMPSFTVVPLNVFGDPIPTLDVQITATTPHGTVTPALFTGRGSMEIEGIVLRSPSLPDGNTTSMTFTVTSISDSRTASVSTGPLTSVSAIISNRFMLFDTDSSLFSEDNIGNTAVMNVAMPAIVINLYSSQLELDTSNTGLVILATSDQSALSGAEALFVSGKATFSNLAFTGDTAPNSAVITFTAGLQGNLAVKSSQLYSGSIAVTQSPVKARHMRFSRFSTIAAGEDKIVALVSSSGVTTTTTTTTTTTPATTAPAVNGTFAPTTTTTTTTTTAAPATSKDFTISGIEVEITDSSYQLDPDAYGFSLEVQLDPPQGLTIVSGGPSVVVKNGLAHIDNLVVRGAVDGQEITIRINDPQGIRSSVATGKITLRDVTPNDAMVLTEIENCRRTTGPTCQLTLQFMDPVNSYVFSANERIFATVGVEMPVIRIQVIGPLGTPITASRGIMPRLVAYTDNPLSDSYVLQDDSLNEAVWRRDRYAFTCLQYKAVPSGLIRMYFTFMDTTVAQPMIRIAPIRSGFANVVASVEQYMGIKFSLTESIVQYPLVPVSAVVDVALPPISIEVLFSDHKKDTGAEGFEIVATTSSGTIDSTGARATVSYGVATFYTIRYVAEADFPSLTFTIVAPGNPMDGSTVTTGPIMITKRPIEASEIIIAAPENTATPNYDKYPANAHVTYTFNSLADVSIYANLAIRNSAHVLGVTPTAAYAIVEPLSDEVVLSASPTRLTLGNSAVEYIQFQNIKATSYKTGNIAGTPFYITFTIVESSSPRLLGRSARIGPITLVASVDIPVCVGRNNKPTVVTEIEMSIGDFAAKQSEFKSQLSYLMGVEESRINIANMRNVRGIDHRTVRVWTGTKVDVQFDEPTDSSTNRKSSNDLASELVLVDPDCGTSLTASDASQTAIKLKSAYYLANDQSCDAEEFRTSLNASDTCNQQGTTSTCDCYLEYTMQTYGIACAADPAVEAELFTTCALLSTCRSTLITNVCEDILEANKRNWMWIWGTVGGVAGAVIIAAVVAYKCGVFTKTSQLVNANKDVDG